MSARLAEKRAFPSPRARGNFDSFAHLGLSAALLLAGCARHTSAPPLECVVDYGGQSHQLIVQPTTDPYRVLPLALEDAFHFKAVYVTTPPAAAALNFYVYYLTERGPVIAEQTKFRPPFPRNAPSLNGNFTGSHHVYGPDGEELVYSCRWRSQ